MRTDRLTQLPKSLTRSSLAALVLIATIGGSGCGDRNQPKAAGQAIADVNDSDVTYLQLNYLLQSKGIDASQPDNVRKTLEALIDQELLVQEAVKSKLDRDPEILQALEMAKRQILVEAYARNYIYSNTQVSEADVEAYYNANPGMFEKRRQYDLNVFEIDGNDLDAQAAAGLDKVKSADEVRSLLQQRHITYHEQIAQRSSEQLPLSMVEAFGQAKVGDVLVLNIGNSKQLMHISGVVDKPLSLDQAKGEIERFLAGSRNRDAMQARVEQLRGGAHINYLGEFAKSPPLIGAASTPKKKTPSIDPTKTLLTTE